jgi:hypothetical protein
MSFYYAINRPALFKQSGWGFAVAGDGLSGRRFKLDFYTGLLADGLHEGQEERMRPVWA